MTILLMRRDLVPLYRAASDAHPGLLLQRGLTDYDKEDNKTKTEHIGRVVSQSCVGDFYRHAYERWKRATSDTMRFRSVIMKLETRLFAELTGGGMLETGCAIGHSHGVPYIPGSSVKGVVNAHARERLDSTEEGRAVCDELFGAPAAENRLGLSGIMVFHDAWWVPDSSKLPLTPEVVTTHHQDYYGKEGDNPATDFDSPVPNVQIAVQGDFVFVIEGPSTWLEFAEQVLVDALRIRGIGARTRTGYGLFSSAEVADIPAHIPAHTPLRKGDAIEATLYKDDRGRWCGRTRNRLEGTVYSAGPIPDDAVEGRTRTLYVRVERPLQFLWERPVLKSPPPRRRHRR